MFRRERPHTPLKQGVNENLRNSATVRFGPTLLLKRGVNDGKRCEGLSLYPADTRLKRGVNENGFRHSIQRCFVLLLLVVAFSSSGAVSFKALNSFRGTNGAQPFGQLLRTPNGLFYGTTATGGANGMGTIFSATTGGALNAVASFDGINGAQPLAGLVQAPDGSFYGTASSGGAFGKGTIFVVTADGTLTNLYSFDGTNGARPLAPLIFASDGNFYGTASAGGAFDLGTIFRMDPFGNVTLLVSFAGTNGAQPAGALLQSPVDGNFYGTTPVGGFYGYGTVFGLQFGVFTNVYSFTGGRDGAGPQGGLTYAADGNLYGTTATGGTNVVGQGAGTVFAINPAGIFATMHRFIGPDGANPVGALVQGMVGVLYGTTSAGGPSGHGTIFSVDTSAHFTNLFSFVGQAGSGPAAGLMPGTNGNFFGVAAGGGKSGLGTFFELSGFSPFIIVAPISVTAVTGDTVVLTVLAGGSAPLSYRWQMNSNNVVNGGNVSGVTSPTLTVTNIKPTQAGFYTVTVQNSAGQTVSASAQVNVILRPTISITSPQRNAVVKSSFLNVAGMTSGDLAVARVYYQLNDAGWQLAASSDNWKHWHASVTLPPGGNRVDAYAESVLGTTSKTNSVIFSCAVTSAPVVVEINGEGTVHPNLDGQLLQLGKSYSMTAVPAAGWGFAGWSGDVETNSTRLVFVMESNLVLQANFVVNSFVAAKGTYNGLFRPQDGISNTNSGFVSLTVTGQGAFTGHLQLGLSRYPVTGRFDMDGNSQVMIAPRNLTPLTLNLHLNLEDDADQITGTVSDGDWTAGLIADRSVFSATSHPAPNGGQYTLVIPGDTSEGLLPQGRTLSPAGDSYGTLTVDKAGKIHFTGSLADNTKVTQTVPVSHDGNWPFYVSLYGGQGSISGWLTFTEALSPTGGITGDIFWSKPPGLLKTKYYLEGFSVIATAVGSSYYPPAAGSAILNLTNANVTFVDGNLVESIVNAIALDSRSRVTNLGTNALSLSFSVANGLFHGSVTDPSSSQEFPFSGVVLQAENIGAGYFLGPTQSGEVRLEAP